MSSARYRRPRRHQTEREDTPKTSRVLTSDEQNCSAYRLSRVPQKFNQNKSIQSEKYSSIMEEYYASHPDEQIDKRTPDEKSEELQKLLENEELTDEEKLPLLVRDRMINFIKYGENSIQSFRSYLAVGTCYSRQKRYISSIRNFEKAHRLEQSCEPTLYDSLLLAIETTEAHCELYKQYVDEKNDAEAIKHFNQAEETIAPFKNTYVEDHELRYRKSLVVAHILQTKSCYKEAIPFYNTGIKAYQDAFPDADNDTIAVFCVHAAINAELVGDEDEVAVKTKFYYYKRAYEFYKELGMEEEAKEIEPKLPKEGEYTETEPPFEEETTAGDGSITYQTQDSNNNYRDPSKESETNSEENKFVPHEPEEKNTRKESSQEPENEFEAPEPEKEVKEPEAEKNDDFDDDFEE